MAITAARLEVEVGADTREAEAGVKDFDRSLNSMTRNMTRTGVALSAAVTAPLIGIATAALNTAGGFEQSMNILQQVVGATESDIASLTQQALELGAATSFSAGEAAEGMLELGKAGLDSQQIMAAIPGVMDLPAAAGTGLGEAPAITAAALNAFGLEASESGRIANLLAAAANASAADITDLSQGLKQAGFAFDLANQPIENLVASLAILTNVGLTGSDAGTALKNAFMRMMDPTKEAAALMRELGITFYDASGNMRQLPQIIDILNTAMADLTPQQRDAALATIFLSDGMKAMIPLMDAGAQGFNDMVTTVSAAGAATEVANARMQGFRGGIEYLKGSIDSFLIGTAMPFLDTLSGLARGAGDALTAFGALPQPIINASLAFAGVMAAAGPLLVAIPALSGAFSLLLGPVGLVVTAIAALAAAWVADVGGIQGITATAFSSVQQWFTTTAQGAQQLAGSISTAFSKTIFPDIESLWQDFQAGEFENIANRIRQATYVLMVNLDAELNITARANQLKEQLVGVVNALGTAIGNLDFSGAQANLNSLRDGILSSLSTAIDGIDFGQASTAFSGIVDGITKAINGLDLSAINWAMVFQRILLGPMGVALNAIQWVVGSENFAGLVTSVQTAFREINWGDIGTALAGLGTAVATQLGAVVSDMASDISAALPNVQLNLSGMMNSWTNAINNQDWSAVGRNLTSNISTAISDFMATDVSWAENFANQLPGRISAAIAAMEESDLNAAFSGLAVAVRGAIYGILTGIGQELSPMISSLNERFSSSMSALGADIRGSIASTVSGWNTAFSTALEGLGAAIRAQIANIFSGLLSSLGIAAGGGGGLGSVGGAFPLRDYAGGEVYDVGGKKGRPSMRPPAESAAMDIPPVEWDTYIKPLDWATYVTEFVWDTYIVPVTWNSYVEQLAWDSYVSPLEWASYVTSLVWDSFVPRIDWGSYVENLSWGNYVGDLSWGNYVPPLEWARFIPQFTQGPSSSESGQSAPVAAAGVSAAGAGAAGGITLNVYATVANDIDIHSLAQKLMREIQRNTR